MSHLMISPETIEYISREIGDSASGTKLVDKLKHIGIDENLIIYPNTKWVMIKDIISYYADERYYQNGLDILSKIIELSIHPLHVNFDDKKTKKLVVDFNKRLKYDGLQIHQENNDFKLRRIANDLAIKNSFNSESSVKIFTKEEIYNLLKKYKDLHQSFKDLLECFCDNVSDPTDEINNLYLYLRDELLKYEKEIVTNAGVDINEKTNVFIPFKGDLFSAESEWCGDPTNPFDSGITGKLSWDELRPRLNQYHSLINYYLRLYCPEQESDFDQTIERIAEIIGNHSKKEKQIDDKTVRKLEILHKYEKTINSKVKLSNSHIEYSDDTSCIFVNNKTVSLPPQKNEHYFCKSVFQRKKKENIDWSIIYQEMTGKMEPDDPSKNKRTVMDTMYALNKRIKEVVNTDDDLFIFREKTVTRQF